VCVECEEHTKPSKNRISCHSEECGDREKLLETGECEKCPDYMILNGDGK